MAKESYEKASGKDSYQKSNNSGNLVDEIPFDKYERIIEKRDMRKGIKEGTEESAQVEPLSSLSYRRLLETAEKGKSVPYIKGEVAGYAKHMLINGGEFTWRNKFVGKSKNS